MSLPDEPVAVEPVQDDGIRATVVGLALWAAAALGCLLAADQLAERGAGWWIWTCVAALATGLAMLWFAVRRARVYRAARDGAPGDPAGQKPV